MAPLRSQARLIAMPCTLQLPMRATLLGTAAHSALPARCMRAPHVRRQVTEEQLINTFSSDALAPTLKGSVEAVRVVRDPSTNMGKGFAFVMFRSKAAARTALMLDQSKLVRPAGCCVRPVPAHTHTHSHTRTHTATAVAACPTAAVGLVRRPRPACACNHRPHCPSCPHCHAFQVGSEREMNIVKVDVRRARMANTDALTAMGVDMRRHDKKKKRKKPNKDAAALQAAVAAGEYRGVVTKKGKKTKRDAGYNPKMAKQIKATKKAARKAKSGKRPAVAARKAAAKAQRGKGA